MSLVTADDDHLTFWMVDGKLHDHIFVIGPMAPAQTAPDAFRESDRRGYWSHSANLLQAPLKPDLPLRLRVVRHRLQGFSRYGHPAVVAGQTWAPLRETVNHDGPSYASPVGVWVTHIDCAWSGSVLQPRATHAGVIATPPIGTPVG